MINNYYTLKALVDEIGTEIVSSGIEACYTHIEHTLEIIVRRGSGQPDVIVVSCKPHANFMFMRSAPRRHTGANVFHDAIGCSVLSMTVPENERTVELALSGGKSLQINLFGPHANAFLTGPSGEVEDTFLKKKTKNTPARREPEPALLGGDVRDFVESFDKASGSPLQKLTALLPPFAGDLGKEAFYRTGGGDAVRVAKDKTLTIDKGTLEKLYGNVSDILHELSHPEPRIYYDGDNPVTISLVPLHRFASLREEVYDSVNRCVSAYASSSERHRSDIEMRDTVSGRLVKRKDELARTIAKIEADISGNRETRYRECGNIIMAQLTAIEKGADTFTDPATGEEIGLNPELNAVQNAQAYYEKSKKARESYRQAMSRKELLKKSLAEVEAELAGLDSGMDRKRLVSLAKSEKKKEKAQTPFREFETNGYMIYVGKDARNNDSLTFGFAKPNDIFLHARGVSGSHVIIRNASREYPQKPVLEFAARIAAHYSKARTSGIVPVAYTMRKFVKKAKGQPGAVFVGREEVIFVKPGIPQATR